jgi:enoyl-CoA hydratase
VSADLAALLAVEADPRNVEDHVAVELHGPICLVTLARPEQHNVLSLASWRRLGATFAELARSTTLRAVVVRGSGGRAFGAGADIKEFGEVRLGAALAVDYNEAIATTLRAVGGIPAPVIAMVDGLAVGGGCELAAACDLRIASDRSRFGIPIGRLGVTLGYTEASAVARLVGPATLKYLLFTGRLLDAEDAAAVGLIQRVVPAAELNSETATVLEAILNSSEVTIRAAKLVADMLGRPLSAADTETLTRLTTEAYDGADLAEGVAAFEERRAPNFTFPGRK